MKRITLFLTLFFTSLIFTNSLQAQNYADNEVAQLRSFLRQPAVEEGKLNINKVWKTSSIVDTANWEMSTAWVDSLTGLTWKNLELTGNKLEIPNKSAERVKHYFY